MEKSLYFEYVRKYFPKLILSIVEKLNDANQTQLSYMFKQLLSTEYSGVGNLWWGNIRALRQMLWRWIRRCL